MILRRAWAFAPGATLTGAKQRPRSWTVLRFNQMSNTVTIRLSEDLAAWLDETARGSGVSRGSIVRGELERVRNSSEKRFLRMAGPVEGSPNLSTRKGFSP